MPLRLVLDTNVWLDWLVFHDHSVKPLRSAVACGEAEIVINAACTSELLRVLAYPLQKWTLDVERQTACIAQCRMVARMIEACRTVALPKCTDPDDQKFLELAAGVDAHYLVTRDLALLALARRRPPLPFHIVTPVQFALRPGVESFAQGHAQQAVSGEHR
jgi:putative PIN family toxin of toxin-antitoxin system